MLNKIPEDTFKSENAAGEHAEKEARSKADSRTQESTEKAARAGSDNKRKLILNTNGLFTKPF